MARPDPKNFIERMYDMGLYEDEDGMTKFDEQRLKREFKNAPRLFARNADMYRQGEPMFSLCTMYNPCPLCDKCQNKASHLYVQCQTCQIPICVHTHKNRRDMLRRENFTVEIPESVKQVLRGLKKTVLNKEE